MSLPWGKGQKVRLGGIRIWQFSVAGRCEIGTHSRQLENMTQWNKENTNITRHEEGGGSISGSLHCMRETKMGRKLAIFKEGKWCLDIPERWGRTRHFSIPVLSRV